MRKGPSCKYVIIIIIIIIIYHYDYRFHRDPSGTYTEYEAKAIGNIL